MTSRTNAWAPDGPARRTARWVTVFNGSRDAYQVPLALAERDMLEALVTDWYTPVDRPWARSVVAALPTRWRRVALGRYREGVPSRRVVAGVRGAVHAHRAARRGTEGVDAWLGERAGRLASARDAGILAYSYYAGAAFAAAGPRTPRLIFQVHPHPRSLATLYAEEMARVPAARHSLSAEFESRPDSERFASLSREAHLAHGCIAASSFTARTLIEQGIDASRLRVVPYGVDLDAFAPRALPPARPFRVLFVGQMVQRKGLSYLLDAWRRLALPDAELILAGRGFADDALLAPHAGLVTRRDAVSGPELAELYRTSHVFCMPSIAEGFGLVYLEALASGTPVIGTPNTGAPDVVRDGREGFIVPIRDPETLAARLRWCYDHPAALAEMRGAARARAEMFSWRAFRSELASAVESLGALAAEEPEDARVVAAGGR